ncbi:hypothetical protein Tsubulata_025348 [Turnera subulata]|uniref:RecA family profile 1 domain-containing protein n=1 Tax=Turnera subulata TaxID=218843 RepID=A0A9Q0FXC5_9ROSI|nr:hypothetical protein Tsubulata_025348 [Turnera subulata]
MELAGAGGGGRLAKEWIDGDESAREMLRRVLREESRHRFLPLPPPLDRVPARAGNVVELVGPSPSGKTHALMEAAIGCILPEEWQGVRFGGLGRLAMFIDLDCRLDVSLLADLLRARIARPRLSCDDDDDSLRQHELFGLCMRRFLYVSCFDSLQFLATLKTLHYQVQKQTEAQGVGVHLLMIDSIGAFYWMDRASTTLHVGVNNRKGLSLQQVLETVVQEIKNLMQVHPVLVIATKATIMADRHAENEVNRNRKRKSFSDTSVSRNLTSNKEQLLHREYMPYVWQDHMLHPLSGQRTATPANAHLQVKSPDWLQYMWFDRKFYTCLDFAVSADRVAFHGDQP